MHPALTAYLEREKAAQATPQGADCRKLSDDVAQEYGIDALKLRTMIIDHTVKGPN